MLSSKKNLKDNNSVVFFIFFLTILLGYYFNEDSLGGAKNDFLYHFKLSDNFKLNFLESWNKFGTDEHGWKTRNSPIFWIFLSVINKFLEIDLIRLLNTGISLLISIFFYKCLIIKFKSINHMHLCLVACSIFLSPTIRSLSIWPYSLAWALLFFLISIYYYLLFEQSNDPYKKLELSIKNILFLVLSSYIYPSFSVFYIYFFLCFFNYFGKSKKILYIIIFSLILSVPAIYFVISRDFFQSIRAAEGLSVSIFTVLNPSNKITIISSLFLFFIIPFLNFKKTYLDILNNLKISSFLFIISFCFLNFYFFDYPYIKGVGFGGGFFHKISNHVFENNTILFISSFFSIIIIFCSFSKVKINYLLFATLIAFNLQLTIYNKYLDPLIIIIVFLLFKIDMKNLFFEKKYNFLQLYFFTSIYLFMGMFKDFFLNLKI